MVSLKSTILMAFCGMVLYCGLGSPAVVQAQGHAEHGEHVDGLRGELLAAISTAEQKFNGLAEAMDETQFAWRPAEGVRSSGEVLLHIAATNYWLPISLGIDPPAGVPIAAEFETVMAFEQETDRAAIIASLGASFEHFKAAIASTPDASLDDAMEYFGMQGTVRSYLVAVTTHLSEHLGQLVAYARMNGVTPPWSR